MFERLSGTTPITNIPELLGLHHSNPIGINPLALLIFIFIVAAVMEFVNFKIRRRGKSNLYPTLYALFGVAVVSIYYYCFMDGLPIAKMMTGYEDKPCIGWFCHTDAVGAWGYLGLLGLISVVYWMICAVMQVTAQMSVHAGLSEGKKWKEWKWGTIVALVGLTASVVAYIAHASAATCSWILFASQLLMIVFCLIKLVADCVRGKNAWGVAISLVFYLGIVSVIMLSIECMYGAIFFFVALLGMFATAKARKKKPKGEKNQPQETPEN